jgi:hypothetical protein
VEDYQRQLLALLCRCEGLSAAHEMNLFTVGLGEPMASDVAMRQPVDLQSTMSLTQAFERCASVTTWTTTARYPPRSRQTNAPTTMPTTPVARSMTPVLMASVSTSSLTAMTHSRFCHLSPEEMANKHKKDECYFCLEKFSLDHKCASKGVFLMELEEIDDPEVVANKLGVSLHALTGLCCANTMQLIIHIGNKQLRALVDSSSIHSFVHEDVVHALGLGVVHHPWLSMKVANGEQLQSCGVCKATTMHIQGEKFMMDWYTLPLEGFDVILGVQWLKSLGLIVWDFAALSMVFLQHGR